VGRGRGNHRGARIFDDIGRRVPDGAIVDHDLDHVSRRDAGPPCDRAEERGAGSLAILAIFPESLVDVGFQMSFAAVVALVSAYEFMRERASRDPGRRRHLIAHVPFFFGGIIVSTLIASAAVAPLAAYHFHKSQQYAALANLIAIPICNVLVMPAALATLIALPFGLEWFPLQAMGHGIEWMVWCAYRVAALPGAVARIPSIPTAAFALVLAGGLWLALWRARWRWLGLIPIALGLTIAPWRTAPDVLIGRNGDLVAVRTSGTGLAALAKRSGMFELSRWLEHDGDDRRPEAATESAAFRCDASGCAAAAAGRIVAVARHASALRDDCDKAAVLILAIATPHRCREGPLVITQQRLREAGAHALYFRGGEVRVETVADAVGRRPWSAYASGDPPGERHRLRAVNP
jgi:competence protein ComEC